MNLAALCWIALLLHTLSLPGLSCGCAWPCDTPGQQGAPFAGTPSPWTMQKSRDALAATCTRMGHGMSSSERIPEFPQSGKCGSQRSCPCSQGHQERPVLDVNTPLRGGRFRDYRRLSRDNLTEHLLRGAIYRLIQREPGIDMPTITRMICANPHTIRYHLTLLVTRGRVISRCIRGRNRYYSENNSDHSPPPGTPSPSDYSPTAKVILSCITARPGITRGEVAECARISGPSATRWLQRLADAGLIVPERDGKYVRYHPARPPD